RGGDLVDEGAGSVRAVRTVQSPGAPGTVAERRIRDHFFGVQPPVEVEVKAGLHSDTALGTRLVS
ncbi:MAG TPA: hypothetical protein D7I08_05745, partial [Candidatus Poseidoniales archaeon]